MLLTFFSSRPNPNLFPGTSQNNISSDVAFLLSLPSPSSTSRPLHAFAPQAPSTPLPEMIHKKNEDSIFLPFLSRKLVDVATATVHQIGAVVMIQSGIRMFLQRRRYTGIQRVFQRQRQLAIDREREEKEKLEKTLREERDLAYAREEKLLNAQRHLTEAMLEKHQIQLERRLAALHEHYQDRLRVLAGANLVYAGPGSPTGGGVEQEQMPGIVGREQEGARVIQKRYRAWQAEVDVPAIDNDLQRQGVKSGVQGPSGMPGGAGPGAVPGAKDARAATGVRGGAAGGGRGAAGGGVYGRQYVGGASPRE